MNPNPNPFKHVRFIKTILQAFAFVTACCTAVWIALAEKNNQWNNRSFAIVALSLLGFAAILMINSLSKKDRAKTLIWIVVFLCSSITIVVLALQSYMVLKSKSAPYSTNELQKGYNSIAESGRETSSNIVGTTESNISALKVASKQVISPTGVHEAQTNKFVSSPSTALAQDVPSLELDTRLWIIPDISVQRKQGGFYWEKVAGAPPNVWKQGDDWGVIASHFAGASDLHEWYVDGPWKISGPDGTYSTNSIGIVAAGWVVFDGTIYSTKNTNTCKMLLWRPQAVGGDNTGGASVVGGNTGGASTTNGELFGNEKISGPSIDTSKPHSILDFIRIFQSTNN
jgi:hypothetical protein